MSSYADNIARWNAIPMTRESPTAVAGTKRSRSRSASPVVKLQGDYDSSDEDDVSLVSRSPSPNPDKLDITKYDELHPAPEKEVITIETKIRSTNRGYSILAKLGWTDGQPLGLSGDGRVDPIPFAIKNDVTGLGKRAQDERMIETTVSQRRGLDSERQIKETMEQRLTREQKVAEKEALANQIASTLKPFYCALCDKQYQTVAQYDEHTNSYAHHHRQRFKDMQTNAKGLGGGKQDKEARLAKERKREEKELKRMAKARGVKVGVIGGVAGANVWVGGGPPPPATEEQKGFKKSGWATVGATQAQDAGATSSKTSGGWATVSSDAAPAGTTSGPSSSALFQRASHGFRTAGFETLETTSIVMMPPQQVGDGSQAVGRGGDVGGQRSRWANTSAAPAPPPPPPTISPPPPPPVANFPPPPPPPPSWPPQPPSPLRFADSRVHPPSRGPPYRNDRMSSSFREPSPGQYPGDRPPSPRSYHGHPGAPFRSSRDSYDESNRGDCRQRYRGQQGNR